MENIKLSEINLNDIKDIACIDSKTFTSFWDEKQWMYEAKENPVSKILVKRDENHHIIAYLDYWITFDSSTIAKIAVDKSYLRQHLATSLMDEMMLDLKQNEVLYITLEVRVSNLVAIALYEKYGFKTITTKPHYYNDGEDALYMVMEVK